MTTTYARRRSVILPDTQATTHRDSPDQIFLFDQQGCYVRISGEPTDAEQAADRRTTALWAHCGVAQATIARFDAQIGSVFETGQPLVDEATYRSGDETRSYEYVLSPLRDNGVVHTVIATLRDTTDRKRGEQRLFFLSEASKILDSSLDYATTLTTVAHLAVPYLGDACIVHVVDDDGTIEQIASVYADDDIARRGQALRERYHYQPDGPFGVPQVLRTGRSALYPAIDDDVLRLFSTDEDDLRWLRRTMPHAAMFVPLRARGMILGTLSFAVTTPGRRYTPDDLAVAEDLAYRAALAIDNARLYAEAQQAIRIRDDFLSIASHELRSPLTTLQLQIDGMLRTANTGNGAALTPDRLTHKLETSKHQVQRFSRLLDDLLDVSQIASGHIELDLEDIDLGTVVRDVVAATEEQARLAGSTIRLHRSAGVQGRWDRARIEQIVTNLLTNAVKFSNARPIDIGVHADDDVATLVVRDHGIGIAPEDLKRIFNRFERGASSQGYAGSGLGLYIVRRIVEALDGTVDVHSIPGQGSTFTVRLPFCPHTTQAALSEFA